MILTWGKFLFTFPTFLVTKKIGSALPLTAVEKLWYVAMFYMLHYHFIDWEHYDLVLLTQITLPLDT